jgi:hypothetical protein
MRWSPCCAQDDSPKSNLHSFPYSATTWMAIRVKLRASIFLITTSSRISPSNAWHHHPLTDNFFHYSISTQIRQRLDSAWTQVTGQPDPSSPLAEYDLSPNPVHDPTRLTEQLDPDAASLLPQPVPLGQAAPCAPCRIVPMLNPTSNNSAHLTQLTLRLDFPHPPPQARTEARMKLFPQNQNRLKIDIGFWK